MRLATIRSDGAETTALLLPAGAVPLAEVGWVGTADLFSLLESGRFWELLAWWNGLPEADVEELSGRAVPRGSFTYAPLYRRPRKIWGIGLNYAEHAGDLSERPPAEGPASFMKPDTTIIGPGDEIRLPPQSGRVTGEAELGLVIGREAKNVSAGEAPAVVA